MNLNIQSLKNIINNNFSGDYKKFAEALNINYVTAYRVLTRKGNPGSKFISNFIGYCKKSGLNFEDYIFFS